MKNFKTITKKEIKISSNKKERTFTICTESAKYRTTKFSKEEFAHADRNWSGNDWQIFLSTTDDYYKI